MDWLSPVTGLVGALIGASASTVTARIVLKHQLNDAREAREDAERTAVVGALSRNLDALEAHASLVPEPRRGPENHSRESLEREAAEENSWEDAWEVKLRAVKVGALEVRHEDLRIRLLSALEYVQQLHVLEYAFHGRTRRWVLSGVVEDMTQAVYAWRRGENALPAPNRAYQAAKDAFETNVEEWEIVRQEEEADRQSRGWP